MGRTQESLTEVLLSNSHNPSGRQVSADLMLISIGHWGAHRKNPEFYGSTESFLERHSGRTLQDKVCIEVKRKAQLAEEAEHAMTQRRSMVTQQFQWT